MAVEAVEAVEAMAEAEAEVVEVEVTTTGVNLKVVGMMTAANAYPRSRRARSGKKSWTIWATPTTS